MQVLMRAASSLQKVHQFPSCSEGTHSQDISTLLASTLNLTIQRTCGGLNELGAAADPKPPNAVPGDGAADPKPPGAPPFEQPNVNVAAGAGEDCGAAGVAAAPNVNPPLPNEGFPNAGAGSAAIHDGMLPGIKGGN